MENTFETLKFNKTTTYEAGAYKVIFLPISNTPGYWHKIVIALNGVKVAQDWLPIDQRVSAKNANFFYNKHVNNVYPDGDIVKKEVNA